MGQGKKTIIKTVSLFLVAFLVLSATTGQAYAYRLKDKYKSIFGNNNIIFWNRNEKIWKDKNEDDDEEDDNGDCVGKEEIEASGDLADIYNAKNADKQYTDIGSARWGDGNNSQMARVLEGYGDLAYRLGKAVGAPWVAILVQMRYEDPESVCGKNNFWGNGCPPGTGPGGAKIQGRNLGEGFVQYGRTLTNGMHNQALGITNPKTYLEKIGPTWVQGNINGKGYGQIEGMKKSVDSLVAFIESPEGQAIVSQFGTFKSSEDLGICDNTDDDPDDDDEEDDEEDDEDEEDDVENGGSPSNARAIMNEYRSIRPRNVDENPSLVSKYSISATNSCRKAPSGSDLDNCVAFVKWYIVTQSGTGTSPANLGNGSQVVKTLISRGWKNGGHMPKVGAVFSKASGKTMCGNVLCGHTGVVLAIENNVVYTGEAGCSEGFKWTGVKTHTISDMTSSKYTYAYPK